jgi:hypothetical protein
MAKRNSLSTQPQKSEAWWDSSLGKITTAVIIPIIVSIMLFHFQSYWTVQNDQKIVANKFLSEIQVLEPNIISAQTSYSDSLSTRQPSIKIDSIYPPNGLYYTNSGDLGKLDPSLTRNLTLFYFRLTKAEDDRKMIINELKILSTNSTANDYEKLLASKSVDLQYNEILDYVNSANSQIPELKTELQAVENKKQFIFF